MIESLTIVTIVTRCQVTSMIESLTIVTIVTRCQVTYN